MKKLKEPSMHMTLHMPVSLHKRLDTYMLRFIGRTYGKNDVINTILDQFLYNKGVVIDLENGAECSCYKDSNGTRKCEVHHSGSSQRP